MTDISVSVIVPTYNRPSAIYDCVQSLTQLDYPADLLDILIVDDGSKESVRGIIQDIPSPFPIQVIRQENLGVSVTRNAGIQQAKGDLLVFTDDDCQPEPDWIRQLVKAHQHEPNAMLGGRTENGLPNNIYSTASQLLNTVVYNFFNCNPHDAHLIASNNMALSRSIIDEIGGFVSLSDAPGAEDRELVDRWRWSGYPVHYVPSARIRHFHHMSFWKFCRQHWHYGKAAYYYQRVTHDRKSEGTAFEGNFYLTILKQFIQPDDPLPFHQSLRAGVLLVLSQAIYVVAVIVTMLQYKLQTRII